MLFRQNYDLQFANRQSGVKTPEKGLISSNRDFISFKVENCILNKLIKLSRMVHGFLIRPLTVAVLFLDFYFLGKKE